MRGPVAQLAPVFLLAALWAPGWILAATADLESPVDLLRELDRYPHARQIDREEKPVVDYEIGLGPIQKFRGAWSFEESERLSGKLTSYTWQIVDGFTSAEVMRELLDLIEERDGQLLFGCDRRACGHPAQWANRVFHQRVLYGRQDMQHYRVYRLGADPAHRLVVYASARTADRQYLHVSLLRIEQATEQQL